MHTKQEIAAGVRQAITDRVGYTHAKVGDEKDLELDLGLDRIDVVELVMNVEESFDIEIAEEEAKKVNTVGDLIGIVTRKLEILGRVEK